MRKITLISDNLTSLLVKQLAHELSNYSIYMSFAAYFSRNGYPALEEYYRKRADEEYKHHKWCVDYLIEADSDFVYPAVEGVSEKFTPKDMLTPFSLTVDREIETTQMIYAIKQAAIEEKDYMTSQWLNEYLIKEQIEEENTSRMAQSIAEQEDSWLQKSEAILELLEN